MIKKIFIFLSLFFFNSHISAEVIASKLSGNFKIEGSASIEVHSTPLVDEKNIKKSKEKLFTVINFAENQSTFIKKKIKIENLELNLKELQRKFMKSSQTVLFTLKMKKIEELDQVFS